ncbi:MAG: ABC transporter permease [Rhodospirillales bacterium]|nr:ABC transporter permease [Rhodospirillales bacterium]MDH3911882.1 ABC transporter permease [Rhodospirillales bacterium]MDH3917449.1 ABC transporter permease [Rhodospirillales bacterium]MDH3966312.1 ABC transporter permease [Rhodospirillales bacterium]
MKDVSYIHRPNRPLAVYAILYLGFLYLPVLFLPLFSFNDATTIAFPLKGFTLRWYEQLAEIPALHGALLNSLKVGAVTAVVSTFLGIFAAKAVTRYTAPGLRPAMAIIMVPLVIPEVILGTALLILVVQLGMELSLVSITVGHIIVTVPFAVAMLISRFEGFDKSMEEASSDLGENAWWTFWRVTFPLVFPGILASLLVTFTISFDEFIMAFFLSGTETTLPVYMWSQLRFPARLPSVLALGALILLASFFVVTFAEWIRRRGVSRSQPGL